MLGRQHIRPSTAAAGLAAVQSVGRSDRDQFRYLPTVSILRRRHLTARRKPRPARGLFFPLPAVCIPVGGRARFPTRPHLASVEPVRCSPGALRSAGTFILSRELRDQGDRYGANLLPPCAAFRCSRHVNEHAEESFHNGGKAIRELGNVVR